MPTADVQDFRLMWHPVRGGIIEYRMVGEAHLFRLPLASAEFAAAAAILKFSPVFVTNGWLHTGPEPVAEALE